QAIAPQVETFAPGAQDIVPGVSAVAVDGHTPGHSGYLVADGDARLLYIGDSAHHHVISVQRPRWTIQFDRDPVLAEDSREAPLARLADESLMVSSPHFPFPGVGRIERRGDSFAWVPAQKRRPSAFLALAPTPAARPGPGPGWPRPTGPVDGSPSPGRPPVPSVRRPR